MVTWVPAYAGMTGYILASNVPFAIMRIAGVRWRFGASDEVLGVVEAGVEFEKRIAAIYHKCRSPQQIDFEFNEFQTELEAKITASRNNAHAMLLDNFDQEVIEKVKVESNATLSRVQARLWALTRNRIAGHAAFVDANYSFTLHDNPFPATQMHGCF